MLFPFVRGVLQWLVCSGSDGAIYGELTVGGMQKVINVLKVCVYVCMHAYDIRMYANAMTSYLRAWLGVRLVALKEANRSSLAVFDPFQILMVLFFRNNNFGAFLFLMVCVYPDSLSSSLFSLLSFLFLVLWSPKSFSRFFFYFLRFPREWTFFPSFSVGGGGFRRELELYRRGVRSREAQLSRGAGPGGGDILRA